LLPHRSRSHQITWPPAFFLLLTMSEQLIGPLLAELLHGKQPLHFVTERQLAQQFLDTRAAPLRAGAWEVASRQDVIDRLPGQRLTALGGPFPVVAPRATI
jgi:hypothetical protein